MRETDILSQWTSGSEIHPEFGSKIMIDSEQTLLNFLKRKESDSLDGKLGHTIIKIAAAATESYQPLDVGTLFRSLVRNVRSATMNGKTNLITDEWDKVIKHLQDNNNLIVRSTRNSNASNKLKTIRDIVGVTPECFQKVFTV